eukprot:TRINITY_DN8751_c0_g1_i1.p1 TRINITY_DN8751_c0_g1~~TRINITY_DN8751_c0_g1_i1.p1  ORF type:complete len:785 (+),score=291.06 TRINITY_DN8751_c0_g1_i1:89-2356(+)
MAAGAAGRLDPLGDVYDMRGGSGPQTLQDKRKAQKVLDKLTAARTGGLLQRLREAQRHQQQEEQRKEQGGGEEDGAGELKGQLSSALSTLRRMCVQPRGADLPLWDGSGDYYAFDYVVWSRGLPPFSGGLVFPPRKPAGEDAPPGAGGGGLKAVMLDLKAQAKEMDSSSGSSSDPEDREELPPAERPGGPPRKGLRGVLSKLGNPRASTAGIPLCRSCRGAPWGGPPVDILAPAAGSPAAAPAGGGRASPALSFGGAAAAATSTQRWASALRPKATGGGISPGPSEVSIHPVVSFAGSGPRPAGTESPAPAAARPAAPASAAAEPLCRSPSPAPPAPPSPDGGPRAGELERLRARRAERLAVLGELQSRLGALESRVTELVERPAASVPGTAAAESEWLATQEAHLVAVLNMIADILTPEEAVVFNDFVDKDSDLTCALDRWEVFALIKEIDPAADEDDVDWFVARCMESIEPKEELNYLEFYQWWQSWLDETGGDDARGAMFKVKMKMRQVTTRYNRRGVAAFQKRLVSVREQVQKRAALGGTRHGVTGMVAIIAGVAVAASAMPLRLIALSHEEVLRRTFRLRDLDEGRLPEVLARYAEAEDPAVREERVRLAVQVDLEQMLYEKECLWVDTLMDLYSARKEASIARRCEVEKEARAELEEDEDRGWMTEDSAKVECLFSLLSDRVEDTFGRIHRSELPRFAQLMGRGTAPLKDVLHSQWQVIRRNYPELLDLEQVQEWWHMLSTGKIERATL